MKLIAAGLDRQNKALSLLSRLLDEEFFLLRSSRPREIAGLQFSIQELLRQLTAEREGTRTRLLSIHPEAETVRDLLPSLSDKLRHLFETLLDRIDTNEKTCGSKATRNSDVALALAEQSRSLLAFFHSQVAPRNRGVYASSGRWKEECGGPSLFHGRL